MSDQGYRHFTNLPTPFDAASKRFLKSTGDYLIGEPVPATHATALPLETLVERGIVGIYLPAGQEGG